MEIYFNNFLKKGKKKNSWKHRNFGDFATPIFVKSISHNATISSFFREINYALKIRRFCYSKIPWNQLALKFRYFMSYPKNKMCTYIWCDEYACVMDKADDISKNKFSSKWSEQRLPQCNEVIFFLFWKVDLFLLHICLPCLIEFVCIKLNINTLRRNGYVIWTS